MARAVPATPPRRTQAERRAATRGALLDAAIAVLVEEGYANLTTRRVAERAGVSQGTQMHYFPTRGAFVGEAVRYVAAELERGLREQVAGRDLGDERRRVSHALDELWRVHQGPIFQATMELWVAARTDDEIRESMAVVARDVSRRVAQVAAEFFPELSARRGAQALLDTTMASIRGLAMLRFHGDPGVERRWKATRAHLLELHDGLPAQGKGRAGSRARSPRATAGAR